MYGKSRLNGLRTVRVAVVLSPDIVSTRLVISLIQFPPGAIPAFQFIWAKAMRTDITRTTVLE